MTFAKPKDQLVRPTYLSKRAKPGEREAARKGALDRGDEHFQWRCGKHGLTAFATHGSGQCVLCRREISREWAARKREELYEEMSKANGLELTQSATTATLSKANGLSQCVHRRRSLTASARSHLQPL